MNVQLNNLHASYDNLVTKGKNIQDEISALQLKLNEIIAQYEVSKEICKTLVEQELFVIFKDRLRYLLKFEDCIFLTDNQTFKDNQQYLVLPLQGEKQIAGYLAIKGLDKNKQDILDVLVNQFEMGLKRVKLYRRLQELAITDSLTGTFSRRYCLERLKEETDRSLKFGFKFSVLMMDIDHFKSCNDHFGHLVGDAILRELAAIIKNHIRSIDLVARFGGEEFMLILPQTSKVASKIAAQRIRDAVQDTTIKAYDERLGITVSVGAANFPEDSQEMNELIDKADFALYRAKKTGRNRVCLYGVYE